MREIALTINGTTINAPGGIPTGGNTELTKILQVGVGILLVFAMLIALFYLIWGGFRWIVSGGDKTAITAARQQIIYSLIGLAIAFAAFWLVSIVGVFFHANLFQP